MPLLACCWAESLPAAVRPHGSLLTPASRLVAASAAAATLPNSAFCAWQTTWARAGLGRRGEGDGHNAGVSVILRTRRCTLHADPGV